MSYSIEHARAERESAISTAIKNENSAELRLIADQLAGEDDMEYAEHLLQMAKAIDEDYWAYDKHRDNELD